MTTPTLTVVLDAEELAARLNRTRSLLDAMTHERDELQRTATADANELTELRRLAMLVEHAPSMESKLMGATALIARLVRPPTDVTLVASEQAGG